MIEFIGDTLNIFVIFLKYFSWWVLPIMFVIVGKIKWSRYPIDAVIIEKRGDNLIRSNDRVGKFFDKGTGHTTYRLLKNKDTIDVLPFDSLLHYDLKNTNFLEYFINKLRSTIGSVHLLKYGSKQYKPVRVGTGERGIKAEDIEGNIIAVQPNKDENGNQIYTQKVYPFDIRDHIGIINFQIIDWDDVNTTLNEIENSRLRRLAKFDSWAKLAVPIAIIAVVGIISIIVLYLTYDAQLEFCPAPSTAQPQQPDRVPSNQTLEVPGIQQVTG